MASKPVAKRQFHSILAAVLAVAAATALGWPLHHKLHLANTNVLMLYLLGVLWIATHYTRTAAVVASVLGVAAFDFTFVEPYYTLSVHDQQYVFTFIGMLLTALTISTLTHHALAREQEARAAWERVEAEFLRNTLLSGVSHELRTPLAAITGSASALIESDERLSASARGEMLETIYAEAERMDRLITNLLDMTRLESGGLSLKKEWQPIQEVIGSALHHADRRLQGRRVTTHLAPDLPLLAVDAVAIEQVLINLLDNAVDHTPPQTPIDISASRQDDAVAIEVADEGPGLKPGTEERIFQKFVRVDCGANRHGFGLGLTICKGIIEAHGGKIGARNRSGGGVVFRFTLPAGTDAPQVDSSA
jgi:K+-sensing histidine kinase KdpD